MSASWTMVKGWDVDEIVNRQASGKEVGSTVKSL